MVPRKLSAVLGILALVLAACAPAATPTLPPTPTATPRPVATPTATAVPGATATPTPRPTATPTAAEVRSKVGGVIRFAVKADPPSWDPLNRIRENVVVKSLVMSRLFTLWTYPPTPDCKDKLQPWLVKDWRWVDDVTAEFTLRSGVRFHDKPPVNGREITAQDATFSIGRFRQVDLLAPFLERVALVEPVDRLTFRARLKFPWVGFPVEVFAISRGVYLLAAEAGGPAGELWTRPEKSWIGTGAFLFKEWQPGIKSTVTRNPNYWTGEGRPYAEAIELVIMPDVSTQMAAMRSGRLSVLWQMGAVAVRELQQTTPNLQILSCPAASVTPGQVFFNTSGPPLDDVRVRRALSMAIDRQAIVTALHGGESEAVAALPKGALYGLSPKDLPPEVRVYVEYHPDRARQLLAEAGYPRGFKTVINTSGRYVEQNFRAVAEGVQSMLKAVGIDAELNLMEHGRYLETVVMAKYPAGQLALTSNSHETPESLMGLVNPTRRAGTYNRSLIQDPEYERMYDEFLVTREEARRTELARQMQIRQVEQAYRVVLPWTLDYLIVEPRLRVSGLNSYLVDISFVLENLWFGR